MLVLMIKICSCAGVRLPYVVIIVFQGTDDRDKSGKFCSIWNSLHLFN